MLAAVLLMPSIGAGQQPPNCPLGNVVVAADNTVWACRGSASTPLQVSTGGGEGVPAGSILLIKSGTCPTGYVEETDLDGRTLIGTTAAAGNVGQTGGSDSITPSAHTGTAVADHASHTHTYTDVIAHTHTIPVGATDDTSAPFDRADAGTNASGANATTATGSTGVATGTTAGPSATLTHSVTQPATHAALDNRSAFIRLIACRKT